MCRVARACSCSGLASGSGFALGECADVFFLGVGFRVAFAFGERADVFFLGVFGGV
jgi:hypothetical protein